MGLFYKREMEEMDKFLKKYISDDILTSGDDKKTEKTKVEKEAEKTKKELENKGK